ncbi:hemolymph lipopolysaccharide-binding protein-like [Diprion similis]|uniref:hemolymph lipopolysaccharide-binding protein-like n=1 Tax=Diprion similis TaxID=362088 RepID=UPI001EF8AD5A|nr:hemolymph lipopolysaccharide-binding protein-like [Diprion similis]
MAVRIFAVQTLLCLVSYTLAQQSFLQPIVILLNPTAAGATGNVHPTCLVRNPPAVRRDDYTYFPGIGGYKYHNQPLLWSKALIACEEEGGHLAVINSLAERDAVVKVIKAKGSPEFVLVGFHDFYQDSYFVTIHGQTLAKAGFEEWKSGEPNNSGGVENCGTLHLASGKFNDQKCYKTYSFICELPIH